MTPHPHNPDACIDHVLNALRTAEAPTGLEARIAARIAQAAEARTVTTSHFAVILNAVKDPRISLAKARLYTVAAALTVLLTLTTLTLLHHRTPPAAAQSKPIPIKPYTPAQPATLTQAPALANTHAPQGFSLGSHSVLANTQVPQGFSLGSPIPPKNSGVLTPSPADPDAIALAETLAPSRPAPPTPLTQQELLMLAVLHSGNQEGIAALDPAKRDALLAQNELAFNNFFAPPPPPPPPPPPTPKTGAKE